MIITVNVYSEFNYSNKLKVFRTNRKIIDHDTSNILYLSVVEFDIRLLIKPF